MSGKAETPTPAIPWKDLDPPVLTAACALAAGSEASALCPAGVSHHVPAMTQGTE